jgi:hypothetical protein
MRRHLLTCAAVLGLSGCVATGPTERQADYAVDLHNVSDRSIGVVVLRVRGGEHDRIRFDLAPGGVYTHAFRQWEQSVAEVRLTLEEEKPAMRSTVIDLSPGKTRLDLRVVDNQVVAEAPPKPVSKEPWP